MAHLFVLAMKALLTKMKAQRSKIGGATQKSDPSGPLIHALRKKRHVDEAIIIIVVPISILKHDPPIWIGSSLKTKRHKVDFGKSCKKIGGGCLCRLGEGDTLI